MFKEYSEYDACGLADLVARREVAPSELLDAALRRADRLNPRLNAICIEMRGAARAAVQGPCSGAFGGVPFLIKDASQDFAGVPTTSGSRALRSWTPKVNAEVVDRWLAAGLVIFGKTATPELALKGITESELWGPTRNPWDLDRSPGGSSGGAAAAVASGIVPVAGASDGGGSIRIPASYCGLFGLRPSRGRVPLGPTAGELWDGAVSTHVLSRSVRDSARMLDVLSGPESGAPFVIIPPKRPYAREMEHDVERLRIGFCVRSPIGTDVDPQHQAAVRNAAVLLERIGHHVEEAEPDIDGFALARSYLVMYCGQVASTIAEACASTGVRKTEFELETRLLGVLGETLSAGDYVARRREWNAFARALGRFHERYDLYMTPVVAQPSPRIGEARSRLQQLALRSVLKIGAGRVFLREDALRELARKSLGRVPFTQLSNITGTPSMSVPMYRASAQAGELELPIGVQFIAPFGDEATLLRLARQIEQVQPWSVRRPLLWDGGVR